MVPARALETVTPSASGERWKSSVSAWVVPEMTTVSKPKSNPPSAATTVLRIRTAFNCMIRTFSTRTRPKVTRRTCSPANRLKFTVLEGLCQRGIVLDSLARRESYFSEAFAAQTSAAALKTLRQCKVSFSEYCVIEPKNANTSWHHWRRTRGTFSVAAVAAARASNRLCWKMHTRNYVEERIRAGVLEQGTVDLMHELGVGERLEETRIWNTEASSCGLRARPSTSISAN